VPDEERSLRQAAVERARDIGWSHIGSGALAAAVAAVRHMEDEPLLNAGIGACLNADGEVELDAGVMEGSSLRAAGVACLRDIRHPIDLAMAVMTDGRHVLLAADGASRFAHDHGIEQCDPSIFITDRKRQELMAGADTVGAVARDAEGRLAVAVSTGGIKGKLPVGLETRRFLAQAFTPTTGLGRSAAQGRARRSSVSVSRGSSWWSWSTAWTLQPWRKAPSSISVRGCKLSAA
jgi:beta-aspartyl-peptidase (threonine type)